MIIGTGSAKTLLSPKIAQNFYPNLIVSDPFEIHSVHGTTRHKASATIPLSKIFERPDLKHKHYLVDFNPKYNGLIGIDLIRKLNASLDFGKKLFVTNKVKIPIYFESDEIKKKKTIFKVTLPPRSEQIINIPVDKDINEGILSYIKFNKVEIPSSFVTVKNQIATTTIINPTEKELCFMLFEPLKIEAINTFYINPEPIITPIDSNIDQQLKKNLKNIRISHLNSEEQRQIKNLCFEYRDIFYCENLPLTFNNQIKHYIRTKDNNPIFTKTYRYLEIHKEEVRKQINSMLTQGIIRPSTSPWSSPIWIVEKKLDASGKKKWR
ncbi:Retrovirus-related Pol polyprotein from transposon 412-like Protein [Tribolium castaneum]|uniref:Retrovirus-related Pol polyprotein from transposon 412-like Protein n=1 Tax=Tribolium castaneum TaxID=7070 RepID=D7GY26_TRICA|nr:Retrovirus-related Pol polyprotein from transposon 412-like Protein [Tribolium castaneum]